VTLTVLDNQEDLLLEVVEVVDHIAQETSQADGAAPALLS
jgi:hypothetical protein